MDEHNLNNPIILEGVWGVGKTTLAQELADSRGYKVISEPLHTSVRDVSGVKDLDSWYRDAHLEQQDQLFSSESVLLERSILSNFAFSYALERELPPDQLVLDLGDAITRSRALLIYMTSDSVVSGNVDLNAYSSDIQAILVNADARKRYEQWYLDILPRKYGIVPFVLRSDSGDGSKKASSSLCDVIVAVIENNRVAQVNVVCFSGNNCRGEKVLIFKRSAKRKGFWQNITGGVHVGENLHEAVRREVFEETGIAMESINPFATSYQYSFMGDDGYILDEYVFGCCVNEDDEVQLGDEHVEFKWVSPKEAKEAMIFDDNRKAIDIVVDLSRGK